MSVATPTVSITSGAAEKVLELLDRETGGVAEHEGKEEALRIAV